MSKAAADRVAPDGDGASAEAASDADSAPDTESIPDVDSGLDISQSGMRTSRKKTVRFDTPVSVAPPPMEAAPRSTPVKLIGAAVVLVLAVAAAASAWALSSDEEPLAEPAPVDDGADESESLAAEPAPAPEPEAEPSDAPSAAAEPAAEVAAISPLLLRTSPEGATVRREDSDLGETPLSLMIPAGERWTLDVILEGHSTRTVTVRAGPPELMLQLSPVARPHAGPQPEAEAPATEGAEPEAPAAPEQPAVYAPELDDPWAH